MLDTPGASIFHVQLVNGESHVSYVRSDKEKSLICNDLGYRASDILQSNCVIWVEGPSDRIYLNHWIKEMDSGLIEGLHYSIMFYGGRLLNHLSADDPEIKEFISLRRLNRNLVILMDRDRDSARQHVNKTKQRIKKEFDNETGFAWLTKGREVENYIDFGVLESAAKATHSRVQALVDSDSYANCLKRYRDETGKIRDTSNKGVSSLDKVKIAQKVVESPINWNVLDLGLQVKALVKFIKESNESLHWD